MNSGWYGVTSRDHPDRDIVASRTSLTGKGSDERVSSGA
jgi:hypothetical protein